MLQYRRELFAAALIGNPHSSCDLEERRRLCKDFVHKWSDPRTIASRLRELPLEYPLTGWNDVMVLWRNLVAIRSDRSNDVDFFYVPPAISQKPPERWRIHDLPFKASRWTAYPPKNVLVVAEEKEG